MLLLALDTSTRNSTVALCSEDTIYAEHTWFSGNNHSVELLDHIQRICKDAQISMPQLDAIAVAIGPGSFNGVRVALSTAKALAFALQKPLVGVGTLDLIAADQRHWPGPICAILEAGRSDLYAACFQPRHGQDGAEFNDQVQRTSDYMLLAPAQLTAYLQEHRHDGTEGGQEREGAAWLLCGEITPVSRQVLSASLTTPHQFLSNTQATRRASTLAALALTRLHAGESDDPLVLEPLYLRRPSITTSTRKHTLLGGPSQRPTGLHTTEREEGALRH